MRDDVLLLDLNSSSRAFYLCVHFICVLSVCVCVCVCFCFVRGSFGGVCEICACVF